MAGVDPISNISAMVTEVASVVGKLIPDPQKAMELQNSLTTALLNNEVIKDKLMADNIQAELKGESWLQRNWRPLLMMVCIVIIGNNLILVPYIQAMFNVKIMLEMPEQLWNLMVIGVGGYLPLRTVEKGIDAWKSIKGK